MTETIFIISAAVVLVALAVWAVIYYSAYAVHSQILGATVWCGRAENRTVALTFDDGPSPETEDLLDVLEKENIKATFFLIGKNVEKYPETVRRIVRENHELGNHSYSHPIYLFRSAKRVRRELVETQNVIKRIAGVEPKIARPPCGVRSPAYFAAAKELNLQTIQWSDTGFDWKNLPAEKIAEKVLETAQSDSIILLHDGDSANKADRKRTVEAVPIIIKGLKVKGLRVAPLADIIETDRVEQAVLRGKII